MGNAYTCPDCGAPITPFAAGCAYCGADLEAARRREPLDVPRRLRQAWQRRRRPVPDRCPDRPRA